MQLAEPAAMTSARAQPILLGVAELPRHAAVEIVVTYAP
jgi:hypothetical protein